MAAHRKLWHKGLQRCALLTRKLGLGGKTMRRRSRSTCRASILTSSCGLAPVSQATSSSVRKFGSDAACMISAYWAGLIASSRASRPGLRTLAKGLCVISPSPCAQLKARCTAVAKSFFVFAFHFSAFASIARVTWWGFIAV